MTAFRSAPVEPASGGDAPRPGRLIRAGQADPVWFLGIILALLALGGLHLTASISALIAGGLFAALIVLPLDRWVAARTPKALSWLGHVAAILAILAILALFAGALAFAGLRAADEFQAIVGSGDAAQEGTAATGQTDVVGPPSRDGGASGPATADAPSSAGDPRSDVGPEDTAGTDAGPGPVAAVRQAMDGMGMDLDNLVRDAVQRASGIVVGALRGAVEAISGLVLVVFLALMMLIEGPAWAGRMGASAGPDRRRAMEGALEALGARVRVYAALRLAMGVLTAILYSLVLWIAGIDLIWTWAILTVLLSFVPTIGSIIAGILPTAYALLTRDLGTAMLVGLGLLAIEQVVGNFVDPRISGDKVMLSPLVVLIALFVWTWVWGAPGAILAVPATLAMVVIGARIEPLRPLALMLTDREDLAGLDDAATA